MFKFLTEEQSVKVKREYRIRRAIIILGFLGALVFIMFVTLLPSYILLTYREFEAKDRIESLSQLPAVKGGQELQTWLAETNNKILILSPERDTSKPYELFIKVLDNRVAGVRITGLSYKKSDEATNLLITGVASDRQALLGFENKLNLSKQFSRVDVPPSSFARDKDISFELNMTPANQP